MIEISINNLVLSVGIFFLLGLSIGILHMYRIMKRELKKLEDDLCN